MKPRALVVRHAAYGDVVLATTLFPYLKNDGFELHVLTGDRGWDILKHNPTIDRLIWYEADSIPIDDLEDFYVNLSRDYQKIVVLTGSIENILLKSYPNADYYWSLAKRRKHCGDKNYYEHTIRLGGYEPNGVRTGQLYFSGSQIAYAKNFRKKYRDKFIILWALSGSGIHKSYLHYSTVVDRILREIPDALIVEAGIPAEWQIAYQKPHSRVIPLLMEERPIMDTFALTSVADLVVGPETGILNAAGCFDTPKICLLTHSSKKNLTATWKNDYSLQALCACSPCHQLHKVYAAWTGVCPAEKEILEKYGKHYPACVGEGFPPDIIVNQIRKVYDASR